MTADVLLVAEFGFVDAWHGTSWWSSSMDEHPVFTSMKQDLAPVLEELQRLEPIFHTQEFGTTPEEIERRMAPDYFEVGASGRRYSRAFIVATLEKNSLAGAGAEGWECSEFGLRQLAADTYQITYTLRQWQRVTRRATLWRKTAEGWQILYHQGTIVAGGADDTIPAEDEMPHPPMAWPHARVRPARARVRAMS